ncbi:PcfJ domain-containing protein [Pararhizobium sp. BT-229]|uniref:PcfJ domain-containing protein n=1 Tax=Pararhizobium sp. BT-229 TaxID=2986923 RepID=UPI0021F75CF0|nr:PcfJ domain-containing protein [Pararhizobium sp. BT-229]MCV9964824.1 PcfJ domain-containing protein [Pararhizobium sp. BT-229]
MASNVSPVAISHADAARIGFAPGCVGIPVSGVPDGPFYVVGLKTDRSRLTFSPDTYRMSGSKLAKAGSKTYGHVGMVGSLNFDHQSNHRVPADVKYSASVREAIGTLRQQLAETIGLDVVTSAALPGEFRPINMALDYVSQGKKDHARLVMRWAWLVSVFAERPDILDRAVAGESLWDLIPEDYDPDTISEMKKLKGFAASWVPAGLSTGQFIPKLVEACRYIPAGGQRPASANEAQALVNIVDFYSVAFLEFPAAVRERLKASAVAEGRNWRGDHRLEFKHAGDYVSFLYRTILQETFRLLGIQTASHDMLVAGSIALFGNSPGRIMQASREWHEQMQINGQHIDPATGRLAERWDRPSRRARSWNSAIDRIAAPNGLHIVPLDTAELLSEEGRSQHHCVSSKSWNCADGNLRVASVRWPSEKGEDILSTFSFSTDGSRIAIVEHRGLANRDPDDRAKEAVWWFEQTANGPDRPFRLDLQWLTELAPVAEAPVGVREEVVAQIEACKATLPRKMQRGGLAALLNDLEAHLPRPVPDN